ncbi:hypothetical protein A3G50_02340 [Candidatus Jorgensenbacteria bacterium RIFCSPLOWO2_12_FULL_42_11]|uniref:Uncharacterized protein n=1 Tax=Candidatus Jorgensenbacteria bacterium RIFCSPLOWO2_12_FULL_42_11 TaxID=1798473 RepID=A0A1F6C2K8_9BACT|nr:MAG: hypothetical protein A3G50_02340 [Candidatus Jorgensenbacteria bacterium RIFCSPLOWO2_12_FULL_42_11]
MITKQQFDVLLEKVEKMKQSGSVDLSTEEDLCLAIMNLLSIEEHFFFTGMKTKKPEYFDLLEEVRNTRKELLARMMDKNEGETWCVSKHLLAAAMRLIETGVKFHSDGKQAEAKEMFDKAYKMYSVFWALRLKLIDASGFKKIAANEKPWSFEDIMNKLVDCCDEK